MVDFKVVIPARFASSRLPGKPLLDIAGKPMVLHVAEQAAQSGASEILIATDHQDIFDAVSAHGYQACMTANTHNSGTERLLEVLTKQGWADDSIIVNVQGDEPLIPPSLISAVAQHLAEHPECAIATAAHPIHELDQLHNPNAVKVVLDHQSNALYFSRAAIPFPRDFMAKPSGDHLPADLMVLRHIGLYAYRASFLARYQQLAPTMLEQFESLEQLRALYYGYKIGVSITENAPPTGVDTPEDLARVRSIFSQK